MFTADSFRASCLLFVNTCHSHKQNLLKESRGKKKKTARGGGFLAQISKIIPITCMLLCVCVCFCFVLFFVFSFCFTSLSQIYRIYFKLLSHLNSKFRYNGADAFRHGFGCNIPGEVLWMGYIAMCGLKGYGVSAVLPILVINKVWSKVNCVHQVIEEGNEVENKKVHKRVTLSECVDKKFAEVQNLNLR